MITGIQFAIVIVSILCLATDNPTTIKTHLQGVILQSILLVVYYDGSIKCLWTTIWFREGKEVESITIVNLYLLAVVTLLKFKITSVFVLKDSLPYIKHSEYRTWQNAFRNYFDQFRNKVI